MATDCHSARRVAVRGHNRVGSGQRGPEPGEPTPGPRPGKPPEPSSGLRGKAATASWCPGPWRVVLPPHKAGIHSCIHLASTPTCEPLPCQAPSSPHAPPLCLLSHLPGLSFPALKSHLVKQVVCMVPVGDSCFLAGFGEPHGPCREPPRQLNNAWHGGRQLGPELPSVPGTASIW